MKSKTFDTKKFLMNNVLYVIMIVIIITIAFISKGRFLSMRVMRDILNQSSVRVLVALGCMFVILSGQADLSGGRMVGLAAVVSGTLAQQQTYAIKFWPGLPELPVIVPVLVSILLGVAVGLCNGWIVAKLRVPAFLATLGVQMILFGANSLYINKAPNNSQPLGGILQSFKNLGSGNVAGINYIIIIAVVSAVLVHILLTKITMGKQIYAVGGNPEAAKVSGINVFKITLITYAIAGAFYGLAGCLECARTGSATSNYGLSYELDAIASCIVGGCSAGGGVGGVPGVFLGVVIFNVINYGLTFIGLSSYWQYVVKGLIIIAAIAIDVRKYDRKS
ncbi:MAG: beta-methylgalactoside transporter [Christensenellaceae bacterium]|nr:beta-methylgalactoside transporter [Christensenellaceae bacterium]